MSSEVWKIGQESKASDIYDKIKDKRVIFNGGEVNAVRALTSVCSQMINAYNEIIEDQNDYILEIDDLNSKLSNETDDIQEKIDKLQKEIDELKKKMKDGTITEDEKNELFAKISEQDKLIGLKNDKTAEAFDNMSTANEKRKSGYKSKAQIAEDFGSTTVEKGKTLAETKVKGGFFRKLFARPFLTQQHVSIFTEQGKIHFTLHI